MGLAISLAVSLAISLTLLQWGNELPWRSNPHGNHLLRILFPWGLDLYGS